MSVLHSCPPPESALRRTEEEALALAGDYLNQYPKLERRIQSALAFRQRLIDIATGVSPRPAGEVRGGGQGDGIGWAVARLADLKEQTDRDVDRLCDLAREIHGRLEALERPRAAALLEEYNAIRKHTVPPVARLIYGQCSGCNTSLPSAILSKIKGGSLVECETCGRMIIQ